MKRLIHIATIVVLFCVVGITVYIITLAGLELIRNR